MMAGILYQHGDTVKNNSDWIWNRSITFWTPTLENSDPSISIEAREFETAEYGRDFIDSGGKRAMIIASHESGEENGMGYFTRWFKEHLPGICIEFIPTTDRLWTL